MFIDCISSVCDHDFHHQTNTIFFYMGTGFDDQKPNRMTKLPLKYGSWSERLNRLFQNIHIVLGKLLKWIGKLMHSTKGNDKRFNMSIEQQNIKYEPIRAPWLFVATRWQTRTNTQVHNFCEYLSKPRTCIEPFRNCVDTTVFVYDCSWLSHLYNITKLMTH